MVTNSRENMLPEIRSESRKDFRRADKTETLDEFRYLKIKERCSAF